MNMKKKMLHSGVLCLVLIALLLSSGCGSTASSAGTPVEKAAYSEDVKVLLTASLEEYLGADAAAVDCTPVDENVVEVYRSDMGYGIVTQRAGQYKRRPITLLVIMDPAGTVQHITVLEANETEGIGTNALTDSYLGQYAGGKAFRTAKRGDGTKIDAFSGATNTSLSVFEMVDSATRQFTALNEE